MVRTHLISNDHLLKLVGPEDIQRRTAGNVEESPREGREEAGHGLVQHVIDIQVHVLCSG
jgi:hypothetical protein